MHNKARRKMMIIGDFGQALGRNGPSPPSCTRTSFPPCILSQAGLLWARGFLRPLALPYATASKLETSWPVQPYLIPLALYVAATPQQYAAWVSWFTLALALFVVLCVLLVLALRGRAGQGARVALGCAFFGRSGRPRGLCATLWQMAGRECCACCRVWCGGGASGGRRRRGARLPAFFSAAPALSFRGGCDGGWATGGGLLCRGRRRRSTGRQRGP